MLFLLHMPVKKKKKRCLKWMDHIQHYLIFHLLEAKIFIKNILIFAIAY